jgi:ATP-dependent NAD(P)H-hydrate dehydratase
LRPQVDADGLWLLAQRPALAQGFAPDCPLVLTPNAAEFGRLRNAAGVGPVGREGCGPARTKKPRVEETAKAAAAAEAEAEAEEEAEEVRSVAQALGGGAAGSVVVLTKGACDVGSDGVHVLRVAGEKGSPRRCGGVGDVLAGTTAVFLQWALRHAQAAAEAAAEEASVEASASEVSAALARSGDGGPYRDGSAPGEDTCDGSAPWEEGLPPALWAAWGAAVVAKRASEAAFALHQRSTTAPDVLAQVGPVAGRMLPN